MMNDRQTKLLPGVLVVGSIFNAFWTAAFRS